MFKSMLECRRYLCAEFILPERTTVFDCPEFMCENSLRHRVVQELGCEMMQVVTLIQKKNMKI